MSLWNWISLGVLILGWSVSAGRIVQQLANLQRQVVKLDADVQSKDVDIQAVRDWGMAEIQRQVEYREGHYLTIERFNECQGFTAQKLDEIRMMDLPTRMARIETQNEQIMATLAEMKHMMRTR
jgi:hypothetical protein